MANEVKKKEFTTSISQWSNEITNLVARDFETVGVQFDEYSKECAMSAMTNIYNLVKASDKVDMSKLDTSNLREIVGRCASLKLNANALPAEVYFQLRNKKVGNAWMQEIEMGIQGCGYDSLLRNYGENVEQVYPVWLVKEGDDFVYPRRKGLEMSPPEWEEKGLSQKVVRVVYPVKLKDNSVQYLISERESVKTNLFAHVRNNLLNECFGIAENRYKATPKQKQEIDAKKREIYDALRKCETVDDMLECEIAIPYISAAWLDSLESMITRKMQNNAIRKFPKNLNTMAKSSLIHMDETYQNAQAEIEEKANKQELIIENDPDIVDAEISEESEVFE